MGKADGPEGKAGWHAVGQGSGCVWYPLQIRLKLKLSKLLSYRALKKKKNKEASEEILPACFDAHPSPERLRSFLVTEPKISNGCFLGLIILMFLITESWSWSLLINGWQNGERCPVQVAVPQVLSFKTDPPMEIFCWKSLKQRNPYGFDWNEVAVVTKVKSSSFLAAAISL